MLDATPVGLRLVIIVDALVIVAVPVPTGARVVLRRLFELVLGKVGPISAEFCIVLQERPRRGVVIFAKTGEAFRIQIEFHQSRVGTGQYPATYRSRSETWDLC